MSTVQGSPDQWASGAAPVVVFDLDHTLTTRDTAAAFFRWLLGRQPARMVALAPLLLLFPLLLLRGGRRYAVRYAVWIATLGVTAAQFAPLIRAHVAALRHSPVPLFHEQGLTQLRAHLAQGHRVVIATGCLQALAQELLRRVDCRAELVGSSLRPLLGGWVAHEHCHGERKVAMLAARGFPPPWSVTYTDHASDLPLLHLSRQRCLVNPTPAAARRITRALGTAPDIFRWR